MLLQLFLPSHVQVPHQPEVAESFSIHSHSRDRSDMMLEEEPRDNFELAKEIEKQ